MDFCPQRIVCLTEESTEWLYLLGQEHRIVGISGFTVRPRRAREEKPKVSAFLSAKIDKILALRPDCVFGFSDLQADIAAQLIRAGIQVTVFNQRSVPEILRCFTKWVRCWVARRRHWIGLHRPSVPWLLCKHKHRAGCSRASDCPGCILKSGTNLISAHFIGCLSSWAWRVVSMCFPSWRASPRVKTASLNAANASLTKPRCDFGVLVRQKAQARKSRCSPRLGRCACRADGAFVRDQVG